MAFRQKYQVAVIGAGPGGYGAAFMAADLGLDVCLIDPRKNPGGVCLYEGCIPSKALLHISELLLQSRAASAWGIDFGSPKIDIDKMRAWKNDVVEKLTGGLAFLCRKKKIDYIQGRARFLDSHALAIAATVDGSGPTIAFDNAVLATGSVPASLKGLPPDGITVLDSTAALELKNIPSSLLVIGGGYIGLEIGTVYASLGTKVSIVEMMPRLLSGVDDDLFAVFLKSISPLFESILVSTTAAIEKKGNGFQATFSSPGSPQSKKDFDKILVAVGRTPKVEGLGIENTKIAVDSKGFVIVDERRRTSDPSIYAIGDIAGQPLLAHKATHEGRIAAEAIAGKRAAFEPNAIPAVVYTDPAIAWCGLTETEAQSRNRKVAVARFPWSASGRALTMGRRDGMTKLIIDPETERVLGAGIVGSGAGELIAEATLAIEMAARASDISLTIHPHPTLSETIMESAEAFFGKSTHIMSPAKADRS